MSDDTNGVAAERLRSFLERVERLEEDKANIGGDIKEVFAEAKAAGFDTKIMREVLKLRAMDPNTRQEQDHLISVYRQAVGV